MVHHSSPCGASVGQSCRCSACAWLRHYCTNQSATSLPHIAALYFTAAIEQCMKTSSELIEDLAEMIAMSPRNLSRVFKESTGLTIVEYLTELRREMAKTLLNNPDYTIDYLAAQCGFKTSRQLQ